MDQEKEEIICPSCDNLGYVYEGGFSCNPEVDNKVKCPDCDIEPED